MKRNYFALLLATAVLASNVVLPASASGLGETVPETGFDPVVTEENDLEEIFFNIEVEEEREEVPEVVYHTEELDSFATPIHYEAAHSAEDQWGNIDGSDLNSALETETDNEESTESSTESTEETDDDSLAVGDSFTVNYITYRVTSVGEAAEAQPVNSSARLTTLVIPGSVTYDGVTYAVTTIPSSFSGTGRETKLVISEGIKDVGTSALKYCYSVTELSLPSTLESFTSIGFENVETITLADGNEYFQLIDGILFTKDGSKLWLYPSGKAGTSYTVPAGITTIGKNAFYKNQHLQYIMLPDSVTTIEAYAFDHVNQLTTMTFGSNVSSVGEYNLYYCPQLTSLTLQNSGTLGYYCVYGCESLETITIDGSLSGYGAYTFYNLPSLLSYNINEENSPYVSSVDGVLYNGKRLLRYPAAKEDTLYVVPDGTTAIAGLAFNYLQNTSTVILNPGVSLTLMAFYYPTKDDMPLNVYFRDKETVTMSSSTSGVFVGFEEGSQIYLPTEAALTNFNTYTSAINPSGSVTVSVNPIHSTAIELSTDEVELKRGETVTVTGTLTPYYSTDDIIWTTSDETIATVNNGVITAVGYGTEDGECTITATTDSGLTKTVSVTVVKTDIETLTVSEIADRTYTGSAQTPSVTITDGDYTLVSGTDFTVAYTNNINVGTASVTVTGIGDYEGSKSVSFVISPKDIAGTTVSEIEEQTYTGEAICPTLSVVDGSTVLTKDTDYTVSYENNINSGTASVIISGIGNYAGEKEDSFMIIKISHKELADIKDSNKFYYTPVYWAVDQGITTGYTDGTFQPGNTVTRGEMVTFLYRLQGEPEVSGTHPFQDVPKGSFYEKAVIWAYQNDIVEGTSETTYSPKEPVTRGQVVTFLYRYAGEPEVSLDETFPDVATTKYYYKAVEWAAKNEITSGNTDGTFGANEDCTRGHAVTFIYRVNEK